MVVAAKTAEALKILNEKIKGREVEKKYLCVVFGKMDKKEATLKGYLTKNAENNLVSVSDKNGEKTIITHYRVLAEREDLSLLEVDLITGRTHQIRAHLSHIGHPLLGDSKYGIGRKSEKYGFKHQALYSYKIKFNFTSPAGALDYLSGKTFEAAAVPFKENFNNLYPKPRCPRGFLFC